MRFSFDRVVPWGRSFDDYVQMFDLGPTELSGRILGCADGPACFNAELHARGGRVVSADPLYEFPAETIRQRIQETYDQVLTETHANRDAYVWTKIRSIKELGELRMAAMDRFLDDYPVGLAEGRYHVGALPALPFETASFDLALCSHFLFTYSDILSEAFHSASLIEMCRVAAEARAFPVLNSDGRRSAHLEAVCEQLAKRGYVVRIRPVPYEFQRGGNEMLVVSDRR